ncbi:probable blue pigment (indigoidine) exporter [Rhizobiales bacterium GAS191]|nr:probable blue pigment (indigoidine) exporter [Rhizobiales bacterium GAS188]SEE67717.1 probable blue pigment (indigoidine) exporter [Rhizobiales bacterium GAS191]
MLPDEGVAGVKAESRPPASLGPTLGGRKFGGRKFGGRRLGGRKLGGRRFGGRRFGATTLAFAAIVLGCVSASAGNLVTKTLLATLPPLTLLLGQLLFSTSAVWAVALALRRLPPRRQALRLAAPGILQPGLAYSLSTVGLATTPVTVETLLFAAETLLVVMFAWPFLGERPSLGKFGLAGLGALGVILVTRHGSAGTPVPLLGAGLILAGVVAAALDTVAVRFVSVDADPLALTAASQAAGLAVVALALLAFPEQGSLASLSAGRLGEVALSGLLLHGIAFYLFNVALARLHAGTAALLFPLIPILTAIGAYGLLDERLGPVQLIGAALVLAAALAVGTLREDPG